MAAAVVGEAGGVEEGAGGGRDVDAHGVAVGLHPARCGGYSQSYI